MDRDHAELLALQVLGWVLENEEIALVFLGSTGSDADQLRARAQDPELLAAVLDFTLMDDAWVVAAARHARIGPEELLSARAVLPGGDAPHWS
ncbi:MAG: DUF3572 domain-containing protein [Pseudomonadota bacterium]